MRHATFTGGWILTFAISVAGQPQPAGVPSWTSLPYLTRVSQAANQLFSDVEQVKVACSALNQPQARALRRSVDAYYEDVLAFVRFLERNPNRERIEQEYRRLDRRGDEIVSALRAFPPNPRSPRLSQYASLLEFREQQLAAAIYAGGSGPIPANHLVRLTKALDTEAEDLLRIARAILKNDPISQQLERDIRGFNRTVDRFRRSAESNEGGERFHERFAEVQSSWGVVTQNLMSHNFLWESTALRQSAVQVSSLVRTLGEMIGSPAPPAPQPGLPGAIVPIIPDRKRGAVYVIGADAGGGPHVRVVHSARSDESTDFMAYSPDFRGGVRVAVGDVDGDGVADIITAPGHDMAPLVRIFSGRDLSLLGEFRAFDGRYREGVWVAAADFDRSGRAQIVCGAGQGGLPIVRVFDPVTGRRRAEFAAYEPGFRGGVRVAVGDINGDGTPDIITTPGKGRSVTVRVFDGRNTKNVLSQFEAYAPAFQSGGFVAAADFARNGRTEIVTGADSGGGPHVRVFDGLNGQVLYEFFPFDQSFRGGVRVACRDVNRDGVPDLICAPGPGIPTVIRIFTGRGGQLSHEFTPFEPWWAGGAFVGCR